MTYSVIWLTDATEEFLELWLDAMTREAVSAAAAKIELSLSIRPNDVGESRSDNVRILFKLPLAVSCRVDSSTRTVEVGRLWYFQKRS